jgi:hypothetical protein
MYTTVSLYFVLYVWRVKLNLARGLGIDDFWLKSERTAGAQGTWKVGPGWHYRFLAWRSAECTDVMWDVGSDLRLCMSSTRSCCFLFCAGAWLPDGACVRGLRYEVLFEWLTRVISGSRP